MKLPVQKQPLCVNSRTSPIRDQNYRKHFQDQDPNRRAIAPQTRRSGHTSACKSSTRNFDSRKPKDLQDLERLAAYLADVYGLPEEEAVKIALRRRRSHSLSELRDGPEFGSHEEVPDLEAGDNMWEAFNAWKGEKEKREARPPELPAPTVTGSGSVSGGLRGYD
ncbi:hypothetical protein BDZ45DRAFT_300732 [Acephala macrosclerotiorum]|nr:hypothetical protein BDZ45DRAFT_300732 [Acephala macrosclerotiorum]